MTVKELIEALSKLPPEAEVEVDELHESEDFNGYLQRDPNPTLEHSGSKYRPHGYVTL